MLLTMTTIVIIISVAMLFAILSSFIPFSNAYWNIVQYSSAYYSAMSAVERWALAVRYAGPWFDWESWWKYASNNLAGYYNTWNAADNWLKSFVSYWDARRTTLYWNVRSKVNSIPMQWQGDVDPAFTDGNLYDYNALNYHSSILIPLWWVWYIPPNHYYSSSWEYKTDPDYSTFVWNFRLSPYLFKKTKGNGSADYAKLCTQHCPWSVDYTYDENLAIVDRVIKGKYDAWATEDEQNIEVSILPSESIDVWVSYYVYYDRDSVIRKKYIWQSESETAKWSTVTFGDNKNPVWNQYIDNLNILSRASEDLKKVWNGSFNAILKDPNFKSPFISFELVNYLWSEWSWNSTWAHHLYPFLEYQFKTNGWYFSDRYYTIKWEWKVWKYDVRLQVKKPTIKDSSLWNFTIIF